LLATRYQFSKKQAVKPEDFEDLGIAVKKTGEVTLETEFEKVKTIDIENWENIRGPRPWEEGQPQVASH
jgi:cytochrome c oxidase assembly protein subunit 16